MLSLRAQTPWPSCAQAPFHCALSQVSLLGRHCAQQGQAEVDTWTIDKSQGRDKPCIILSFVRSNAEGLAGHLLEDACRLNVALTRAKAKLIMVGCSTTLRQAAPLARLLDLLRSKHWICPIPGDAPQLAPMHSI